MKHVLLFLFFALLLHPEIQAQRYSNRFWEAGIMMGLTNYSGDVAERRVELNETQLGYGAFVRFHANKHISFKAHVYSGAISGDDRNTSRSARSYRFGTSIFEGALVGEWKLFSRDRMTRTGIFKPRLEPYLFGGIGITSAKPRAEYYGPDSLRNTYLKIPLPEEGLQTRFVLAPVGAGVRAEMNEWLVLGIEGGLRPVFSDDLDGMKVNGNPNSGDWYYFGGLTISVIIGGYD